MTDLLLAHYSKHGLLLLSHYSKPSEGETTARFRLDELSLFVLRNAQMIPIKKRYQFKSLSKQT